MRIHITGASGSGTTTIGKKISNEFNIKHFDIDDFFWEPSSPPYQFSRSKKERRKLLNDALSKENDWVVSGSLCGWGDFLISQFDYVIFLLVPTDIRINRLKNRELSKFGQKSLCSGGEMHKNHKEFIEWASQYDTGNLQMRSKALHEKWLKNIECDILRYEGVVSKNRIIQDLTKRLRGTA